MSELVTLRSKWAKLLAVLCLPIALMSPLPAGAETITFRGQVVAPACAINAQIARQLLPHLTPRWLDRSMCHENGKDTMDAEGPMVHAQFSPILSNSEDRVLSYFFNYMIQSRQARPDGMFLLTLTYS